jgi:2,5-diamino-6-(ribosylamino)-4(3H)-pyrimidinone 5'-phosphate reductase
MPHPHVIVNMAMTADGKTDTVERLGARLSSDLDVRRVQQLRADADAVLVGGRTLLAEDPRLTVRDADLVAARTTGGRLPQPAKVAVLSVIPSAGSDADLPVDSRFLSEGGGSVIVFTTERSTPADVERLRGRGAAVLVMGASRVDLRQALDELARQGMERLLVEGGGTLVAGLLDAGLVDELHLYVAPLLLGGAGGPTPVGGAGRHRASAIPLRLQAVATHPDGGLVLRYAVQPAPIAPALARQSAEALP